MTNHLKELSEGAKNSHICPMCLKKFTKGVNLEKHMLNHNRENPYFCNICGLKLAEKEHLKFHIQEHQKDLFNNIDYGKSVCGIVTLKGSKV